MSAVPIGVIAGPPGSGKTTVAASIARTVRGGHVEEDVLYDMLPGRARLELRDVCVEQITMLCGLFRKLEVPTLVEGLFFDPEVVAELDRVLGICCVLYLDVALPNCLARNSRRSPGGIELPAREVTALHGLPRPQYWRRVPADCSIEQVLPVVQRHLTEAGWYR